MSNTDPLFEIIKSKMNESDKIFFISHYLSFHPEYKPFEINPGAQWRKDVYGCQTLLSLAAINKEKKLFAYLLEKNMGDYEYDRLKQELKNHTGDNLLHFSYTISSLLENGINHSYLEEYLNIYFTYYEKNIELLKLAKFDTYTDETGENYSLDLVNLCMYDQRLPLLSRVIKNNQYLKEIMYKHLMEAASNINFAPYDEKPGIINFFRHNIDISRAEFIKCNSILSMREKESEFNCSLFLCLFKDNPPVLENMVNKLTKSEENSYFYLSSFIKRDFAILLSSDTGISENSVNERIDELFIFYSEKFKLEESKIFNILASDDLLFKKPFYPVLTKNIATRERQIINSQLQDEEKKVYNVNKKRL